MPNRWKSRRKSISRKGINGEPKEDLRASVQCHVRSDPEVLEVFLEGRGNLVH